MGGRAEKGMTLEQFRILHSTLIEHYQFIENHLAEISAILSEKRFYEGLMDVEQYNMSKLIKIIQAQESGLGKRVLSDETYEELSALCQRRNFWTHDCYYNMSFDRKTGGPKREFDRQHLYQDIQAAEKMRDFLFNRKMELSKEYSSW